MLKRNIGVFCNILGTLIVVILTDFFATIVHEPMSISTLYVEGAIVSFSLLLCSHFTRMWVMTRGDVPRFNTPGYGLARGSRYNTLAVHEKGVLYYAMVEAVDGPTKGIIRTVNFGYNKPPSEFVYHGDRTIIALGTA
jgi:hypothetical protein